MRARVRACNGVKGTNDAPPDGHRKAHVQRAPHFKQRLLRLRVLLAAVPLAALDRARARGDVKYEQRDALRARVRDVFGPAEVHRRERVRDLQRRARRAGRVREVQVPRERDRER